LSADKWALVKVIILTVIEATFAGLLPLGQKMLLENPSIWTATWATLFSAAQVFFLMVFFNMNDTLGATMEKALNKRVFLQMKFMSKRYLNMVKNNNGQMHSSMLASLVRNFGTNLFSALKSATIVSAQLISIALSFGIGKYFWLTLLGLAFMAGLVFFAYKWNKGFSKQRKILDAQQNNRLEQYADQLDIHQTGTSGVMFNLFEKVSKARVQLFRKSELKRALLIGAPRIVPQFVFMWLIYVLAISENRSVPELAMLSGFVTTTMMVFLYWVPTPIEYRRESRGY
jgi:ABC-type multidrug transport system fused ATPase/permease subunit